MWAAVAVLAGCGRSAPECGAEETVTAVKKAILDGMATSAYADVFKWDLELGAIRTSGYDDATGMQSCAAELTVNSTLIRTGRRTSAKKAVRYTSELTSSVGEFYVTVEEF